MKFPIYIDGDLTMTEVEAIFRQAGYVLRSDGAGRMIASRVPEFLRRDVVRHIPATPKIRKVYP